MQRREYFLRPGLRLRRQTIRKGICPCRRCALFADGKQHMARCKRRQLFKLFPDAAGTVSGIITLNYEDASGNPQTISKDFSVSAEEMNMDDFNYDPSMDDVQPEQTGMPVWAWVLIGVCGAVVVIVVIVVVVRKRKKAKALAALEAEDSDEDL